MVNLGSDGSIIIETKINDKQAQNKLNSLINKIDDLNWKLYQDKKARLPLLEQSKKMAAELDLAKKSLFEMENAAPGQFSDEQITEQRNLVSALQESWNKVQSEVERYDASIKKTEDTLASNKERAGELANRLADAGYNSEKMDSATKKAESSMSNFANRLKSVVRSALVFTVITQALSKFRDWIGKVVKSNDEASAAISKLKAALLTMVQPLVGIIIPAFTKLVNILTQVINVISRVISAIFGMTFEQSKDAAENLDKESNAIEDLGGAAAKAEKQLAGFDEINKLVSSNSAGNDKTNISGPDFSGLNKLGLPEWLENLLQDIELKIRDIRFSWDNGTILQNQDAWIIFLSGLLGAVIGGMFGGVSGSVIGLLLGLSVGLITCTFLDKTDNPEKYKRIFIVALTAILGAVIGGIFGGFIGSAIGLSLGLMVGIIAVEFQEGAFSNWDSSDTWNTVLNAILFAVIGFAFGGVVGGVIGLAFGATISIMEVSFFKDLTNEEADKVKWTLTIGAILGAIVGALFGGLAGAVLGLIIGLSIAFLNVEFDKNLSDAAKTAAEKLFIVALSAILGAIIGAMFGGIFGSIVGLTIGLAIGIASVEFDGNAKSYMDILKNKNSSSSNSPSKHEIKTMNIPALATGAVIPPNREFMAILGDQKRGTNIEAPLDTIVQAVMLALSRSGYGGGQVIENVVNLDGEVIYQNQKRISRNHGTSLMEY
nr:MAG TPA: chromosome segregation protein [Caudoviricetes sp.]